MSLPVDGSPGPAEGPLKESPGTGKTILFHEIPRNPRRPEPEEGAGFMVIRPEAEDFDENRDSQ